MIAPAVKYKEQIIAYSDELRYSQRMMYYNGCREHGRISIKDDWDDGGVYQWAILNTKKELVGYIAYNVDFFSSCAYSFGLISFKDDKMTMAMGIRDVIEHLITMRLHRIEFRCLWYNPAKNGYEKILKNFSRAYRVLAFRLTDVFKDEEGIYQDEVLYELVNWKDIRREEEV